MTASSISIRRLHLHFDFVLPHNYLQMATESQIQEFIKWAHRAGAEQLSLCSSGNLSWRISDDEVLVSATGSWLSDLRPEDVSVCRLSDETVLNGVKPSREARFHLGIFRQRPEVRAILHFQSTYATAIACMKNRPASINLTAEIPIYVGEDIPVVPYLMPGSQQLAEAVIEAMKNHDSCFLANHGEVVAGSSLADAFQKAVFFEMGCRFAVLTQGNANVMSADDLAALRILTGKH